MARPRSALGMFRSEAGRTAATADCYATEQGPTDIQVQRRLRVPGPGTAMPPLDIDWFAGVTSSAFC